MQRIKRLFLIFIGLLIFSGTVYAHEYSFSVYVDGIQVAVTSSDISSISKDLLNDGEIFYNDKGITLKNCKDRISYMVIIVTNYDESSNSSEINLNVIGDNSIGVLAISTPNNEKLKINLMNDNSTLSFSPGRKNSSGEYVRVTDKAEISTFYSYKIDFGYANKISNDGTIYLYNPNATTTTTKKITTTKRVTATALVNASNRIYATENNAIIVSNSNSKFAAGYGLAFSVVEENADRNKTLNNLLVEQDQPEVIEIFKLDLVKDKKVEDLSNGFYTLSIKIDGKLALYDNYKAVHINFNDIASNDYSISEITNATIDDDYISFPVSSLGYIGIIGSSKGSVVYSEKSGSTDFFDSITFKILLIVLLVCSLIVLIVSTTKKIRNVDKRIGKKIVSEPEITFELFEDDDDNNSVDVGEAYGSGIIGSDERTEVLDVKAIMDEIEKDNEKEVKKETKKEHKKESKKEIIPAKEPVKNIANQVAISEITTQEDDDEKKTSVIEKKKEEEKVEVRSVEEKVVAKTENDNVETTVKENNNIYTKKKDFKILEDTPKDTTNRRKNKNAKKGNALETELENVLDVKDEVTKNDVSKIDNSVNEDMSKQVDVISKNENFEIKDVKAKENVDNKQVINNDISSTNSNTSESIKKRKKKKKKHLENNSINNESPKDDNNKVQPPISFD